MASVVALAERCNSFGLYEVMLTLPPAWPSAAIDGLIGPWDQLCFARAALGLVEGDLTLNSREILYQLVLSDLSIPLPRPKQVMTMRSARPDDLDFLVAWRRAYELETGTASNEQSEQSVRDELAARLPSDSIWIAFDQGVPVAQTQFNARLPGVVQIGGVWTPPKFRSRGYARMVLASHLQYAQSQGVERAILFTSAGNIGAQYCYESLGFEVIGEYGMIFFEPQDETKID